MVNIVSSTGFSQNATSMYSLSWPALAYCQLNAWEHTSKKYKLAFKFFNWRKLIHKCHLPKYRPCCSGLSLFMSKCRLFYVIVIVTRPLTAKLRYSGLAYRGKGNFVYIGAHFIIQVVTFGLHCLTLSRHGVFSSVWNMVHFVGTMLCAYFESVVYVNTLVFSDGILCSNQIQAIQSVPYVWINVYMLQSVGRYVTVFFYLPGNTNIRMKMITNTFLWTLLKFIALHIDIDISRLCGSVNRFPKQMNYLIDAKLYYRCIV